MKALEFTALQEGPNDPHIFKAVFMAGGPGSGKSTVAKRLFSHTGLKFVDVDRFDAMYRAAGRVTDYDAYWRLAGQQRSNYLLGRLGLMLDGTARLPKFIQEQKDILENFGYDTIMILVNTDLAVTKKWVAVRQALGGHTISEPDLVNSWATVQKNIPVLKQMFEGKFYIVNNTPSNWNQIEKEIDQALAMKDTDSKAAYNILNRLISDQKAELDKSLERITPIIDRFLDAPPSKPAAKAWIEKNKRSRNNSLREDEEQKQPNLPDLLEKFLPIAMKVLELDQLPKIELEKKLQAHDGQATFGRYINGKHEIHLAIADRHPVDILRTLAHELTHFKQDMLGELGPDSGITGSPEENQAHVKAGIIMRLFDKAYPNTLNLEPLLMK